MAVPGLELRGARAGELPLVRDLILRAFGPDEADLWSYLQSNDPGWHLEGVRLAVVSGRPVACTVVLRCRVRGRFGWVDGGMLAFVGCLPEHRRRGYAGATVRDAVRYVQASGMAIAVLYGVAGYYPRFGFVPVLPDCVTTLPCDLCPGSAAGGAGLEPVSAADAPWLSRLYHDTLGRHPMALARRAEPWEWRFRAGKGSDGLPLLDGDGCRRAADAALLKLPDSKGYAAVVPEQEHGGLKVPEAAASDGDAARRLLAGLGDQARGRGLDTLRLALPPDDPLARLALILGGEQAIFPPTEGMALITDWAPLLPMRYAVQPGGLARDGRLVLPCGQAWLTKLVCGYVGAADLLLLPESGGPAVSRADRETLEADFPRLWPKWTEAPCW